MEYKGSLITEMSLFNAFKVYQEVVVKEAFEQKIVIIKPTQMKDKEFQHW